MTVKSSPVNALTILPENTIRPVDLRPKFVDKSGWYPYLFQGLGPAPVLDLFYLSQKLFPLNPFATLKLGARILHVWNTAGVASVIAKFTDRGYETKSSVIARKAADKVGLTSYGRTYSDGSAKFFARALLMARRFDLIHVHSLDRIVPWLKMLYRRPVVLHYHGTDIEGRWDEKESRWTKADYIAVSTQNLLEGGPTDAVWIPNPVDTDLFRPGVGGANPKSAVSFRYGMDAEAEAFASRLDLKLTWLDRWSVPYPKMPETLSKFSYYVDLRKPPGHIEARSVGKAALEALATGLKVVDWTGKVLEGLPKENEPMNVAARWNEVYSGLLRARERGDHRPPRALNP
jgi:glycosyltransferase involved in cell wall biosynthesis